MSTAKTFVRNLRSNENLDNGLPAQLQPVAGALGFYLASSDATLLETLWDNLAPTGYLRKETLQVLAMTSAGANKYVEMNNAALFHEHVDSNAKANKYFKAVDIDVLVMGVDENPETAKERAAALVSLSAKFGELLDDSTAMLETLEASKESLIEQFVSMLTPMDDGQVIVVVNQPTVSAGGKGAAHVSEAKPSFYVCTSLGEIVSDVSVPVTAKIMSGYKTDKAIEYLTQLNTPNETDVAVNADEMTS